MKKVILNEKSLRAYVKEAKKAFPRETYAFLLGSEDENTKNIQELYIPSDQDKWCTSECVMRTNFWVKEAKKYIKSKNLVVLGDIHSHCYFDIDAKTCDESLSFTDITYSYFVRESFKCPDPIVGLLILKKPKHRIRASVVLYPEIKIYDAKIK